MLDLKNIFNKNKSKFNYNEKLACNNFFKLFNYINSRYKNCPNSDYLKLIEIEKSKFQKLK